MSLDGLKIVVTGTFSRSRKDIEAELEAAGADVTSAISGKTQLLIAGAKAGKKLTKAESLGLPIIDEATMTRLLAGEVTVASVLGTHGTQSTANTLAGKRLVLTGEFSKLDRSAAKRALEALGAKVTSAVSGKTDALIAGKAAGASKLDKARGRGTPILSEAQLARLLEGASLDSVLEAGEAPVEDASEHTPFPQTALWPRDGEFRETWPGTDVVKREGTTRAGRRHGRWKGYYASGKPHWITDYVDGIREGEGKDWHENGQLLCEGVWKNGYRHGAWTWWYESGAFKQTYLYDHEGKTHGEYVWDLEDGSPRARGEFWHGKRHGSWTWHGEPNHERMVRGYWRGMNDGEDAGWYPGGQLAYRRHWKKSQRVGAWEEYRPDGSPKSKARYGDDGVLLEKRTWDDDGEETVEQHEAGLPSALLRDEKKLDKIAAKVKKARDSYKKQDAIGDACDYGQRGVLLLHLWRTERIALEEEPALWEMLANNHELLSADDVLDLLAKVDKVGKETYCGHLPSWPRDFDRLVARVYDREPEPFRRRWKDLPPKMRTGVAFVLARAGEDVGTALSGKLDSLARKHVGDYGLEDRLVWWVDGRRDEDVQIYDTLPDEGFRREPNARFYELIELFGTREKWAEYVKKRLLATTKKEHRVPWDVGKDAYALMSQDELVMLLDKSGYESRVETVFTKWRDDDGDALAEMAIAAHAKNGGRGKIVANLAVLKLTEQGKPISDALLEALQLDPSSPSFSWIDQKLGTLPFDDVRVDPAWIDATIDLSDESAPWFKAHGLFDALRALSDAQRRALFDRQLEERYGKHRVMVLMPFIDDPAIWEKGLETIDAVEGGLGHQAAFMLGMLPAAALPLLVEYHGKTSKKERQESYHRAILMMLARMADRGESWPEELDALIHTNPVKESFNYHYVMPLLAKLVHRLPRERAEKVLLASLDARRKVPFCRAVRFIGSHPTEKVLRRTFAGLLELEPELTHEHHNEIRFGLKGFFDARRWIQWMLRNGGGAGLKGVFEDVVGHQEYPKLLEEIQKEGVEAPKELDRIDKLKVLADKPLEKSGGGETVYILRNTDAPEQDTLNRRGGLPPGIGVHRWPMFEEEPMVHLFTLDLETMPELASRFPGKKSMSFFCANPDMNEAWEPYNDQTATVFCTAEEAAAESEAPEDTEVRALEGFEVVPVQVPTGVWGDRDDLQNALFNQHARVLGWEQWVQGDEGGGNQFIMQFDEGFVGINLGDSGVMYVYDDTAFWQCY